MTCRLLVLFFVFNDTATTEIYTLSLHDALPIYLGVEPQRDVVDEDVAVDVAEVDQPLHRRAERVERPHHVVPVESEVDRKSTRLNSSHANISYAVFCLKKKEGVFTDYVYRQ